MSKATYPKKFSVTFLKMIISATCPKFPTLSFLKGALLSNLSQDDYSALSEVRNISKICS
jgi:hypothetical protein